VKIQRDKKRQIIEIYLLTFAFVEKERTADLDHIYNINSEDEMDFDNVKVNGDFIEISYEDYTILKDSLEELRNEVDSLKNENNQLKSRLSNVESTGDRLTKQINMIVNARTPKTPNTDSRRLRFDFAPVEGIDVPLQSVAKRARRTVDEDTVPLNVNETAGIAKRSYTSVVKKNLPADSRNLLAQYKPAQIKSIRKPVKKTIGSADLAKEDEDRGFKVVESKRYLPVYMGRVSTETTLETVRSFIERRNLDAYDVMELNTDKHKRFKSFWFKVPISRNEDVFKEDMWPKGLVIRRFLRPNGGTTHTTVTLQPDDVAGNADSVPAYN
jgi:regulator of replication initiation timing